MAGSRACSARLSHSLRQLRPLLWLLRQPLRVAKVAMARVAVAAAMVVVVKAAVKVAPRAVVKVVVSAAKPAVKAVARVVGKAVVRAAAIVARAMVHVANAMSAPWPKVKCVKSAQVVAVAQPVMSVLAWKCLEAPQALRAPVKVAKVAVAAVDRVKQAQRA